MKLVASAKPTKALVGSGGATVAGSGGRAPTEVPFSRKYRFCPVLPRETENWLFCNVGKMISGCHSDRLDRSSSDCTKKPPGAFVHASRTLWLSMGVIERDGGGSPRLRNKPRHTKVTMAKKPAAGRHDLFIALMG